MSSAFHRKIFSRYTRMAAVDKRHFVICIAKNYCWLFELNLSKSVLILKPLCIFMWNIFIAWPNVFLFRLKYTHFISIENMSFALTKECRLCSKNVVFCIAFRQAVVMKSSHCYSPFDKILGVSFPFFVVFLCSDDDDTKMRDFAPYFNYRKYFFHVNLNWIIQIVCIVARLSISLPLFHALCMDRCRLYTTKTNQSITNSTTHNNDEIFRAALPKDGHVCTGNDDDVFVFLFGSPE